MDFTEDDGDALLILFRLAHIRFKDIPDKLPYNTLLQVAVLCDQYDCVNLCYKSYLLPPIMIPETRLRN